MNFLHSSIIVVHALVHILQCSAVCLLHMLQHSSHATTYYTKIYQYRTFTAHLHAFLPTGIITDHHLDTAVNHFSILHASRVAIHCFAHFSTVVTLLHAVEHHI